MKKQVQIKRYRMNKQTKIIKLNENWQLLHKDNQFEIVSLPHRGIQNEYSYLKEMDYQICLTYKKQMDVIPYDENMDYIIEFEGSAHLTHIYIDHHKVLTNEGGYLPFYLNITEFVKQQTPFILRVDVDGSEKNNLPPFGGVIDYLTYVGLYREVNLQIKPKKRIVNYHLTTKDLIAKGKAVLKVSTTNNEGS